jgi:hypothetical protein
VKVKDENLEKLLSFVDREFPNLNYYSRVMLLDRASAWAKLGHEAFYRTDGRVKTSFQFGEESEYAAVTPDTVSPPLAK